MHFFNAVIILQKLVVEDIQIVVVMHIMLAVLFSFPDHHYTISSSFAMQDHYATSQVTILLSSTSALLESTRLAVPKLILKGSNFMPSFGFEFSMHS